MITAWKKVQGPQNELVGPDFSVAYTEINFRCAASLT